MQISSVRRDDDNELVAPGGYQYLESQHKLNVLVPKISAGFKKFFAKNTGRSISKFAHVYGSFKIQHSVWR